MTALKTLIERSEAAFDLKRAEDQASLYSLSEQLLERDDLDPMALREAALAAPLEFRLAHKLYQSRRYLETLQQPLKIAVVFAMWGEQNRLRPFSDDNPTGEDALRVKLDQLAWACRETPVEWLLYAVDDGCPHGSAELAREMAARHPLGDRVRVLSLAEQLPAAEGPLAGLANADESRKGGAVIHGCAEALAAGVDAVIYTDADNSVHLGQLGLLLRPWQEDNTPVVLGNRKHAEAVLVKQESRWGVGIKLLRHIQRMIGREIFSRGILDTQAAFKLYDRRVLEHILVEPTVYDFSFDTDWIMAVISRGEDFAQVPFAFIDSFEESASITQGPMSTWLTLLKGLTQAARHHGVSHDQAMARVLDEEIHSAADLDCLINALPEALAEASDTDLGNPAIMAPDEVYAWIRQRKAVVAAAASAA